MRTSIRSGAIAALLGASVLACGTRDELPVSPIVPEPTPAPDPVTETEPPAAATASAEAQTPPDQESVDPSPSTPDEPLPSRPASQAPSGRDRDSLAIRARSTVVARSSRSREELVFARRGNELVLRALGYRSSCGGGVDFERAWIGRDTIHVDRETHEHDGRAPSRCLYFNDYEIVLPLPPAGTYTVYVQGMPGYRTTVPDSPSEGSVVVAESRHAAVECGPREPVARASATAGGTVHVELCGHGLHLGDAAHARIDNGWIVVEAGGRRDRHPNDHGYYVRLEGVPAGAWHLRIFDGAAVPVRVPEG